MMLTRNWIIGPQKHIPCVILFPRDDPIKPLRGRSSLEAQKVIPQKRGVGGWIARKWMEIYSAWSYNFYIVLKQYFNKTTKKWCTFFSWCSPIIIQSVAFNSKTYLFTYFILFGRLKNDFKQSLGYCVCSAFQEYLECSHHTVRRQCGDDTARFTKDFLDRMSSSLLKVRITYFIWHHVLLALKVYTKDLH